MVTLAARPAHLLINVHSGFNVKRLRLVTSQRFARTLKSSYEIEYLITRQHSKLHVSRHRTNVNGRPREKDFSPGARAFIPDALKKRAAYALTLQTGQRPEA